MSTIPPPAAGERHASARLFLAFVQAAKALGVERAAYEEGSAELKSLLDSPPLPTAFVPGRVLNEFYRAVAKGRGRESVRSIGLETLRGEVGQLLARLFENSMRLYGRTPEALFSQASTIAAPITRGFELAFEKMGDRAGWLHVRPDGATDPLAFAIWEGVALYFFEKAGTPGKVGISELVDGGKAARIALRW